MAQPAMGCDPAGDFPACLLLSGAAIWIIRKKVASMSLIG
jgi:hypothetical protein